MLTELRIQNFAIIDKLEVRFEAGFNVITGETGAGKSIIIDAVDVLLGGRADVDFIRAGEERASVEGAFKATPALLPLLRPLLEQEGIELNPQPEDLLLTRELRTNGRNICRVNGSTVSLHAYKEIGQRLVDVHGQTEHLSLLRAKEHIALLDAYAGLEGTRNRIAALVDQVNDVRREIDQLRQDKEALARRMDMLGYQVQEIRAVAPKPGEEEVLQAESARLANSEVLARNSTEAAIALFGEESTEVRGAVDLLSIAAAALARIARIDPKATEYVSLAESAAAQVDELARSVRAYMEHVEQNPARLEEVEERIDAINRLKKKYGGTVEAVLAFADKAEIEMAGIQNSEARQEELAKQQDTLLRQIGDLAAKASLARQETAETLAQAIELEMRDLRMDGARFTVAISQEEDPAGAYVGNRRLKFDATGVDQVEFMMAANRGEPLRPLVKVASGGEVARIMLALKGVLSRADKTPTLIFDEIDQGIGGRLGSVLGQKLWRLSGEHQVLCVTHLAQLAGFADAHFKVLKAYKGERTTTAIQRLEDKARVEEIAEMLGAETVSARQSAHDILMLARQLKDGKGVQTPML
jgi:DNA repair protein RecN (Recombination protein N)